MQGRFAMGRDRQRREGAGNLVAKRATRMRQSRSPELLEAAAELFRTKGYAGATTRELASQLAFNSASLYYHVRTKENLLYEICIESLNRIHEVVQEAVSAEDAPRERLVTLIRAHMATALADQNKHATMLIELRSLSPKRRREVLDLRDSYEHLVRSVIKEGQGAGIIRADLSAKHLTLALLNLLNWSIFWFHPEGDLTADELAQVLASVYWEGVGTGAGDPSEVVSKRRRAGQAPGTRTRPRSRGVTGRR
jgi:AcrR family transcriptional regulator